MLIQRRFNNAALSSPSNGVPSLQNAVLFLVLTLLGSGHAYAEDKLPLMIVDSTGLSCPAWLERRAAGGSDATADRAWLEGFLSGYNLLAPAPKADHRKHLYFTYDILHVEKVIATNCQSRPTQHIAAIVIGHLRNRKHIR